MENILRDHHESGVIKYAWTSTILGIYKYGSCIANEVRPRGDGIDMGNKVVLFSFHKNIVLPSQFFRLIIMRPAPLKMHFKMHTLPFSSRQDYTFSSGKFVMKTQGCKMLLKGHELLVRARRGLNSGIAHEKRI